MSEVGSGFFLYEKNNDKLDRTNLFRNVLSLCNKVINATLNGYFED